MLSGGSATNISAPGMANVKIEGGAYVSGLVTASDTKVSFRLAPDNYVQGVNAGSAYEISNGSASPLTIGQYQCLYIESGCTAKSPAVMSGGSLQLERGGSALSTVVSSGGVMTVLSGGYASGITAQEGAKLDFALDENA